MKTNMVKLMVLILVLTAGCKKTDDSQSQRDVSSYYTCPMHPSVISNVPGACPVCNMSLIKVEKNANINSRLEGNIVTLTKRQQLLAGIQTDTVKLNVINTGANFLGKVVIDETRVTSISSRARGRIDKLYVRTSGEYVRMGSPLYEIYSEELLADQKEFVVLTEKSKQTNGNKIIDELLKASGNKLLLWGLTQKQIKDLTEKKSVSPQITFYSPVDGYVLDVYINEGMYVDEGTPIARIALLDQVWVEARIYSNEKINGNSFNVFTSNASDEANKGQLVYNNPVFEAGRKYQLLRLRTENAKGNLIPGMMVYVSTFTSNRQPVLSVPKSAVLSEKMKTVWVQVDQTTFEQRMVETGNSNGNWVEILSGVKENELIVTTGVYLVNSEFILKSGAGQRHDH